VNKVVCVSCFHLSLASRLLFSNKSSVQFIRVTWKLIYTTQEHCWLWTSFCRLAKLHIYLFVSLFVCCVWLPCPFPFVLTRAWFFHCTCLCEWKIVAKLPALISTFFLILVLFILLCIAVLAASDNFLYTNVMMMMMMMMMMYQRLDAMFHAYAREYR